MTDADLQDLVAGLTGRMAMLEALNANMLAALVLQTDRPIPLAAHIMDATVTTLQRQKFETEVEQRIQRAALDSFSGLSEAMLAMVNRLAVAQGRG